MAIEVRRVVTGHDDAGKAVVLIDDIAGNVTSQRAGQERCLLWVNETLPASNDGDDDKGEMDVGVGYPGGSIYGIVKIEPGCHPRIHRTLTVDYGYVMEGSIFLELDDMEVELRAGDTFIQRGTIHAWNNRGTEDCMLLVTLIDAIRVTAGGQTLDTV
jgi:quercetin dioxygenase-like cupin family protein